MEGMDFQMSAMRKNGFGMKANLEKQARKNHIYWKTVNAVKAVKEMSRFRMSKSQQPHFGACQNCGNGMVNKASNVSCSAQIDKNVQSKKENVMQSSCQQKHKPHISKSMKKEVQPTTAIGKDKKITYSFRKYVDDSLRFYNPKETIKDTETLDAYFELAQKKLSGRESYDSHMKEIFCIIKESIPEHHRKAIDEGFADAMEYRNQRLKETLTDLDNKFYLMMAEEIMRDEDKPLSLALGRETRKEFNLITYLSRYIAEQEVTKGNFRGIYTKTREKILEYVHLLNWLVQLDLDAQD